MTRYVITERSDEFDFWDPVVDLPAMQPGDSVRVTLCDDGGFEVVPLWYAGTRLLNDGMGRTIGLCRPSTVIDLWVGGPAQENDR